MAYPMIMNCDHANTNPEDRPDWPLPSFDASEWAAAYCKIANRMGYKNSLGEPMDEAWMTTWFANALMRGHDEAVSRMHAAEQSA